MKRIILLICAVLFIQLRQAASKTIICERIGDMNWYHGTRKKTCVMQVTTTIDSDDFSISPRDSSALGLYFEGNKKVSFLPIKVNETFPNLHEYDARSCSLKTISKTNFKNLTQLKYLYLSRNQIESIISNTFEDLTSLEVLALNGNQIKQMNGAAFGGLNKLKKVWLSVGNVCINKDYLGATAIANSLAREVNENCKFTEPESSLNQTNEQKNRIESLTKEIRELSNESATLKTQLATAESLKLQSEVTIQKLSNEVATMKTELANAESLKLQSEVTNHKLSNEVAAMKTTAVSNIKENSAAMNASLRSALESKLQLENQIAMMTSMHLELKNSWDLVCQERSKELTETVQSKYEEIRGLLEQQENLRFEVNEKRTQIENLKSNCNDQC